MIFYIFLFCVIEYIDLFDYYYYLFNILDAMLLFFFGVSLLDNMLLLGYNDYLVMNYCFKDISNIIYEIPLNEMKLCGKYALIK